MRTFRNGTLGVALGYATLAGSAFAQTSITVDSNLKISFPGTWKVEQKPENAPPPSQGNAGADLASVSLLLTASPADLARKTSLTLFRSSLRSFSPPPSAGPMGVEAEMEKVLNMVLCQGFTPTATNRNASNAHSASSLTIEVTAKNALGEERVFTDTVVARSSLHRIRLFASRPAKDEAGAREIALIVQSLEQSAETAGGLPGQGQVGRNTSDQSETRPHQWLGGTSEHPGANNPSGSLDSPVQNSPAAAQLVQRYHAALIIVEGQKGAGSGFLCTQGGHTFAVTNAHVLSENPGFKLTTLDGSLLKITASSIAVGSDMIKLEVANTPKSFEIMANINDGVKINDPVVVLGNAEGARVVKPVEGKVVGIGPDLIEVDAPFVPGNSGSPIIHVPTGKVLGVATYLIERKVDSGNGGTVKTEVRRFGYRIDAVKAWEPINWPSFFAQSEQMGKIESLSNEFIKLFNEARKEQGFDPSNYENPALQRSITTLNVSAKRGHMSLADRKQLIVRFLGDLRVASRSDILGFDSRNAYDYFRRGVQSQIEFRDGIYQGFTRSMQIQSQ